MRMMRTPNRSKKTSGIVGAAAGVNGSVHRGPTNGTTAIARWAMLGLLFAMITGFSLSMPSLFFTFQNLKVILATQAVTAILAIGMIFPMVVGGFDLSIGAVCGAGQLLFVGFCARYNFPLPVALIAVLAICTCIGCINGLLVTRIGINPFISTLGMGVLLGGLLVGYTGGGTISSNVPDSLLFIARGTLLGVPLAVYYMIVIALIAWHVLERTPFGRYLYAIGGSKEAARLAGINVKLLTFLSFVISGFLGGIGGILTASRMGTGDPNVGPNFLLPVFAAALLGAAAYKPGVINVPGTIIAILTLAVGVTGLQLEGAPFWIEPVFNGLALVVAVIVTRYLQREAL